MTPAEPCPSGKPMCAVETGTFPKIGVNDCCYRLSWPLGDLCGSVGGDPGN
jgi:hypothetical protein